MSDKKISDSSESIKVKKLKKEAKLTKGKKSRRTPDLSKRKKTKEWLEKHPKVYELAKELLGFLEQYREPSFPYGWFDRTKSHVFKFGRDSVGPRLSIRCNENDCTVTITLPNDNELLDELGFSSSSKKPDQSKLKLKFEVESKNQANYEHLIKVLSTNLVTPLSAGQDIDVDVIPEAKIGEAIDELADFKGLNETEKDALVKVRIGQGSYRDALDDIWKGCALTGIKCRDLLRASHIKAWRDAEAHERLDPYNGLLLAAHLDALFDKGLISFDSNGFILISDSISESDLNKLSFDKTMQLHIPQKTHEYMKYHREKYGFGC
ncbi:HNH endonuclease [Pseudoalteromonas lipolytica]|uniref:HNH endonuclease n=1 Tax=Pseudoalteromonas lipolytica TaxID=570156 RepID=UPI0006CA030D|nr:HNH endonuclease [Pseudoalteromonas lipolytica]